MDVPNVPVVPHCSNGGGNTSTPPSCVKISPSKHWVFTLNNYTEDECELICSNCSKFCKCAIVGKEVGDSGTPHLQGYLEFLTKKRPKSVFKCDRIHWEKARGSKEDNLNYCSKESVFFKIGFPAELKKLACEDNFFEWQEEVLKIIRVDPEDRLIYWFRGNKGGEGKTTFCKYLVRFHKAIVLSGKCADMKHAIVEYEKSNGFLPTFIVINIPKSFNSDFLSYPGIEEIKDMLFHSGKYEGGMVDGNPPHLFCFSNHYPDIDKVIRERWRIYDIGIKKWIHVDDIDHD